MSPERLRMAWNLAIPDRLDDRARDSLSASLGLTFHGVDEPGAHTIAHRFVEDDRDTLLRIVRSSTHSHAIQLIAFGTEVSSELAGELELAAGDALAQLPSRRREPGPTVPLIERLGERLAALADQMLRPTALLPARLRPIEVLGESTDPGVGPIELVLPGDARRLLAPDIQQRVIFDGSRLRVWLSGTWSVAEPSRLVLYAVDPAGEIVSTEAELAPGGRGRVRLELSWTHRTPPVELLVAVLPRE